MITVVITYENGAVQIMRTNSQEVRKYLKDIKHDFKAVKVETR